jgi:O-antigen/teichoic acid export membrane protein
LSASLIATEPAEGIISGSQKTPSLRRLLLYGGATLGVAVGIERVFGFLSAMLAARIGGPQIFGAYSVVLATAGTIAAYAGAGIGTTANRFSGQYPRESPGYPRFLRALIIISVTSATVAGLLMLAGAGPLAHWMLRNEGLTAFLRLAAISSAAMVLVECCRGLLVGQQRFHAVMVLSIISGAGLIVVLPLTARISAGAMVAGQGGVALLAVFCCVAFSRRLGIAPTRERSGNTGPKLRPVFMFGVIQFSAIAGISIASWMMASLVARSDPSLKEMGLYAVANQFRGLAAIAPGLFIQVGYALLTNESGEIYGGPRRVLLANTFLTTSLAAIVAGLAMTFLPWILSTAYGATYMSGEVAVLLLLATALIHMAGMPAAHRLSIVSLRAIGFINAAWAVLIVLLGVWLVPKAGAAGAAAAFLIAHGVGHAMVILGLIRADELPDGYLPMSLTAVTAALGLACIGYFRAASPLHAGGLTLAMLSVLSLFLLALIYLGVKTECVPRSLLERYSLRKAFT